MRLLKLILWMILLVELEWSASFVGANPSSGYNSITQSGTSNNKEILATGPLLGPLSRSSRQSRCVRCYEDRYETDRDRSRYYGGYSNRRTVDDDRSNWYYSNPSYRGSQEYDRDDRYSPRSYYDEGRRYEGGRYYDRGDSRYNYESRDRYSPDRYYDRSRQTYDRDNDRYSYTRYDYRNYRPVDETYRGQSGFDNTGRGYYFAGEQNDRRYLPCDRKISSCPYSNTMSTQVTSQPINSGDIAFSNANNKKNQGKNSWSHIPDNDTTNKVNRERERSQSSSYGGRPPRPLGGSYLFDRDTNVISDDKSNSNKVENSNGQQAVPSVDDGSNSQKRTDTASMTNAVQQS